MGLGVGRISVEVTQSEGRFDKSGLARREMRMEGSIEFYSNESATASQLC